MMKVIKKYILFGLLLIVSMTSQAQRVRFYADTAFAMPGGIATLQLELSEPAEVEPRTVDLSAWQAQLGAEDTIWADAWQRQGTCWALPIHFMFLDTGMHVFPALDVPFVQGDKNQTLKTIESVAVIIEPFPLADDQLATIKDIIPEPKLWTDFLENPWVVFGIFFLLLCAVLYFFSRKKKGIKKANQHSQLSPSAKALKALQLLEQKELYKTEAWKAYYSELTFILRDYFEAEAGIEALESTSDEIIAKLKGRYTEEDLSAIERLFVRADLVKFAKGLPPADYYKEAFELANRVVKL